MQKGIEMRSVVRSGLARTATIVTAAGLAGQVSGQTLYGVDFVTQDLVRIDAATGSTSFIGNTNVFQPGALDLAPDGSLLTVSTELDPGLYRLDRRTGASSLIGRLGVRFEFEGGLAVVDDSTAYFVGGKDTAAGGNLYRLDLATGAATTIGSLGTREVNGLTIRSDGALIGYSQFEGLLEIDTSTAAITSIGDRVPPSFPLGGLASFDGATAYLASATTGTGSQLGFLYTVDLFSGVFLSSVEVDRRIAGIAVPGPGGASALGLPLVLVCASRRRARGARR